MSHPRLRVLYVIDSLAAGGAERSLADMAPRLVSLGIDLAVAVLLDRPGLGPELKAKGVPVHVVGGGSRAAQYSGLVRLLRNFRPDLLHTTLYESDVLGRLAAAPLRIPVTTTLATTPYGPEHAGESSVGRFQLRAAQLADLVTARVVRRFHAVSQSTAQAYVDRLHIDPAKVEVIPRGRDQARLGRRTPERTASVRARLGLVPGAPLVLAVGRQEPPKGFDVILGAFPPVVTARPESVLMVAGREGRDTERLQDILKSSSISRSIRFLGEREDVPDLMAAADVFVLSSYREGLPGVVLEAMALEVPIVASDLPTVREALPTEEYARLIPAGDQAAFAAAIIETLSDGGTSRRLVAASRRRFEECFDIDAVCAAMAGFYRAALSG